MYHLHDISGPSLKGNSNEFNSHKFRTFMFLFNGWPISISLPRKKLLKENILSLALFYKGNHEPMRLNMWPTSILATTMCMIKRSVYWQTAGEGHASVCEPWQTESGH